MTALRRSSYCPLTGTGGFICSGRSVLRAKRSTVPVVGAIVVEVLEDGDDVVEVVVVELGPGSEPSQNTSSLTLPEAIVASTVTEFTTVPFVGSRGCQPLPFIGGKTHGGLAPPTTDIPTFPVAQECATIPPSANGPPKVTSTFSPARLGAQALARSVSISRAGTAHEPAPVERGVTPVGFTAKPEGQRGEATSVAVPPTPASVVVEVVVEVLVDVEVEKEAEVVDVVEAVDVVVEIPGPTFGAVHSFTTADTSASAVRAGRVRKICNVRSTGLETSKYWIVFVVSSGSNFGVVLRELTDPNWISAATPCWV
jgi:hypothetical protein